MTEFEKYEFEMYKESLVEFQYSEKITDYIMEKAMQTLDYSDFMKLCRFLEDLHA